MNSATRFIAILLCVCVSHISFAQTTPTPKPTATVQGRVTLDGTPYAGGIVMLQSDERGMNEMLTAPPAPTAVTDSDGRYRFAQVATGKYRVTVHAQAFVSDSSSDAAFTVSDGDAIENRDFKLSRGGVITGRVTDPEGHPRIEEMVRLNLVEKANKDHFLSGMHFKQTDDRGVYRIFGVPAGKYKVIAGGLNGHAGQIDLSFNNQPEFVATYHPNTEKDADGKIVEVRAGTETDNVDIVLVRATDEAKKGFTVSGRIVDGDSGKPVSGSMVMLMPNFEGDQKGEQKGDPPTPAPSDGQGQFRFNAVSSGSYQAMLLNVQGMLTGEGGSHYADPVKFTVAESNVTGLEIKLKSGATVQGTMAFDTKPNASPDPTLNAPLAAMMLVAMPAREPKADDNGLFAEAAQMESGMLGGGLAMVNADRSFLLKGLRPGKYQLMAQSLTGQKPRLVRIERNGATIQHIEITGTETINNVRLIFAAANSSISGRVQVQGGTLPAGSHFSIVATHNDTPDKNEFTESDVRGQFNFAKLTAGTYQVRVMSVRGEGEGALEFDYPEQSVTVAENGKATVVVYVNLKKKENQK